jgi:hypothetical protein
MVWKKNMGSIPGGNKMRIKQLFPPEIELVFPQTIRDGIINHLSLIS